MDTHTDRLTDRQTDVSETDKQTDRQTDRQTSRRQTDRQTHTHTHDIQTQQNSYSSIYFDHQLGLFEGSEAAWENANYHITLESLRKEFEIENRFNDISMKLDLVKDNAR